jgi:hypothetical protein
MAAIQKVESPSSLRFTQQFFRRLGAQYKSDVVHMFSETERSRDPQTSHEVTISLSALIRHGTELRCIKALMIRVLG